MARIKLSRWAKENGVHYQTALRYWHKGLLRGVQLPTGTILVDAEDAATESEGALTKVPAKRATVYARVSASENKSNAQSQAKRVEEWCLRSGYVVNNSVIEVGSGLNDQRRRLEKLLRDRDFDVLVVEHKDRLTRFGHEYIALLLESHGKELVCINQPQNDEDDLMADFISLVTSFSARIYGRRRSKRVTERLIQELPPTGEGLD